MNETEMLRREVVTALGAIGIEPRSEWAYWPPSCEPMLTRLDCRIGRSEERPELLFAQIPKLNLDLMHEAEKTLTTFEQTQYTGLFYENNRKRNPPYFMHPDCFATTSERAEAFMKIKRPGHGSTESRPTTLGQDVPTEEKQ